VALSGFLRFHFRRGHLVAAAALLVIGTLVNGLSEFKLHFPGLKHFYALKERPRGSEEEPRVALLEDDFETLLAQDGKDEQRRLRRAYNNLRARGRALLAAFG
jgi:hypothetical protein